MAISLHGFRFSMSVLLYVFFWFCVFVCRSLGESKWRALFATIISKCENCCTSNTPLSECGEKGGNGHVLVEELVVLDDGVVGDQFGKRTRDEMLCGWAVC